MTTSGIKYCALALVLGLAGAPLSAYSATSGGDAAANGGAGTSMSGAGGASTGVGTQTNGSNMGGSNMGATMGTTSGQMGNKKSGTAGCEPTGGAMSSSANCGTSKAPGG